MQLFDIDIELVFDPASQLLCIDLRNTHTHTKYLFEKIYAHPCSLQQYFMTAEIWKHFYQMDK